MNYIARLALILATLSNQAFAASTQDSKAQIHNVIEKFRTSIINKDTETFGALFFSDQVPFIAVFSDEMLAKKRVDNPEYPLAVDFGKFGPPSNMLSGDDAEEEKISNIKIQTDGYLASVHFDYKDIVNGKERAWGTESWSMIKLGSEWKITSVSYTVTETNDDSKE
ncbi:MAG: hypothetical protein CL811_03415 [Colwelliaceae bacterium]|nr:hypothetical protein [Colwelliaceae bacterium]|tara:strand:- start:435 stop:935 length:501 start_codon:yes stop_codon:yes gene_type:complete